MKEAQEVQLQVMGDDKKEAGDSPVTESINHFRAPRRGTSEWWVRVSIYILCLLISQSAALILGRLYFVRGGNSKWMATLVQLAGFPVLIPYYLFATRTNTGLNETHMNQPSMIKLASIYIGLGLLVAGECFLNSIGLNYLPVSTYTLISASQLAFNAFFSFFINSQKFTPSIINALVLFTISSILLVFNNEQSSSVVEVSQGKYVLGFTATVGASATYGLGLSLTELVFNNITKRHTFKVVMDMIIYKSIVATSATVIGLFASGEWNELRKEMNGYQSGKLSYIMNLVWTSIVWQIYSIGSVALIFDVTSLFSNAIDVLGLPIVPVLAVFVFHDKMDGVKVISMVLAIWGFVSYVYQHYIDHRKFETRNRGVGDGVARVPA